MVWLLKGKHNLGHWVIGVIAHGHLQTNNVLTKKDRGLKRHVPMSSLVCSWAKWKEVALVAWG